MLTKEPRWEPTSLKSTRKSGDLPHSFVQKKNKKVGQPLPKFRNNKRWGKHTWAQIRKWAFLVKSTKINKEKWRKQEIMKLKHAKMSIWIKIRKRTRLNWPKWALDTMKFQRSNLYTANKQDNRETSSSSEEYKTEVLSSTKSTKNANLVSTIWARTQVKLDLKNA